MRKSGENYASLQLQAINREFFRDRADRGRRSATPEPQQLTNSEQARIGARASQLSSGSPRNQRRAANFFSLLPEAAVAMIEIVSTREEI